MIDFAQVDIQALPADAAKRIELSDAVAKGLRLVISPTGSKSWIVRYKFLRKSHKLTIGPYPHFTVHEAREKAKTAFSQLAHGVNPVEAKQAAKARYAPAVEAPLDRAVFALSSALELAEIAEDACDDALSDEASDDCKLAIEALKRALLAARDQKRKSADARRRVPKSAIF